MRGEGVSEPPAVARGFLMKERRGDEGGNPTVREGAKVDRERQIELRLERMSLACMLAAQSLHLP
jgi:hypothetical protein